MAISTKIREGDWRSIERAIQTLKTKLGSNSSPTFRTINITNSINAGGSQMKNFAIERVADVTALNALEFYLARMAYVDSEGTLWIATTL